MTERAHTKMRTPTSGPPNCRPGEPCAGRQQSRAIVYNATGLLANTDRFGHLPGHIYVYYCEQTELANRWLLTALGCELDGSDPRRAVAGRLVDGWRVPDLI